MRASHWILPIAAVFGLVLPTGQLYSQSAQPAGACCLEDESCEFVPADVCESMKGTYHGDEVPCDPLPCVSGSGACCLSTDNGFGCISTTESDCFESGGFYFVEGESCDPLPCPTGVEDRSWGGLKVQYRDS